VGLLERLCAAQVGQRPLALVALLVVLVVGIKKVAGAVGTNR